MARNNLILKVNILMEGNSDFIITLIVRQGIVMTSDSRLTLSSMQPQQGGQTIVQLAVGNERL